ncbi:MAG: calcium-binding protein, partial [Cyanobacteria bacterium P01_G01_bin.19]
MSQNQIIGTDSNDYLSDSALDDEIFASSGNDEIETTSGNDLVDGAAGTDKLIVNYSIYEDDLVFSLQDYGNLDLDGLLEINFLSTGNNNYINFYSIEQIEIAGGLGFDRLVIDYTSDDGNYHLTTHPRSNHIQISNPDTGNGKTINFNSIESFDINTGNGDNYIMLSIGHLDGSSSDDIINAGGGNDWIYTDKGSDIVDGGAGFDVLSVSFVDNTSGVISTITGDGSGEYSSDKTSVEFNQIEAVDIVGSSYDDVLIAFAYDNAAYRQAHSHSSPAINGGLGFDELVVDYSYGVNQTTDLGIYSYNSSLLSHNPQTNAVNMLDFQNIEAFNITTGEGNNIINLGYDNSSNDTIDAGGGDDEIVIGKGFDVVDGGNGYDVLTLNFSSSSTKITSSLSKSHSGTYSNNDETLRVDFTRLEALNIIGSSEDDLLHGLRGEDTIYAGLGNDTVRSGNGDDYLTGLDGEDLLIGANGDDSIYGGSGIDTIVGGNGNDLIDGNGDRDILLGGNGNDTIKGGT